MVPISMAGVNNSSVEKFAWQPTGQADEHNLLYRSTWHSYGSPPPHPLPTKKASLTSNHLCLDCCLSALLVPSLGKSGWAQKPATLYPWKCPYATEISVTQDTATCFIWGDTSCWGRMIPADESQGQTCILLTKGATWLGTWNACTTNETGTAAQVTREMRYNIQFLGLKAQGTNQDWPLS